MFSAILDFPIYMVLLISIIVCAGFSILSLTLIRKHLSWENFKENHEVGGFLFNALGLIYAVLVAFVVYATWEDYNSAVNYCDTEANTVQDLYLDSKGLPEQYQTALKEKMIAYLDEVIKIDWPLLSKGSQNPNSKKLLTDIWKTYMAMDSLKDEKQKIIFASSIDKLNTVTDARRQRILSTENHIPGMIWTVIIMGSLTSIGFSLFFGTKSFKIQATMTTLFILTNVIIIIMIIGLDNPFRGDISISADDYVYVRDYIKDSK